MGLICIKGHFPVIQKRWCAKVDLLVVITSEYVLCSSMMLPKWIVDYLDGTSCCQRNSGQTSSSLSNNSSGCRGRGGTISTPFIWLLVVAENCCELRYFHLCSPLPSICCAAFLQDNANTLSLPPSPEDISSLKITAARTPMPCSPSCIVHQSCSSLRS
jgi:hypothetical protein